MHWQSWQAACSCQKASLLAIAWRMHHPVSHISRQFARHEDANPQQTSYDHCALSMTSCTRWLQGVTQATANFVTHNLVAVQSNPFGNAKPVDTVARLKELEERDAKRKVQPPLYSKVSLQGQSQCKDNAFGDQSLHTDCNGPSE